MESASLMRHYQILDSTNVQGWHPHAIVRWLLFLLPLIYLFVVLYYVLKRIQWVRLQNWVSTQGSNPHVLMLTTLFALSVFGIGLYAAIADAWSAREWVLWTAALIFGAFTLLSYSTHDSCGLHVGLAIAAFIGFFWFFFNQWLWAQTKDMQEGIWKRILRNFQGLVTALVLFTWLSLVCKVLVYIFGWSQASAAKFFWAVGILAAIALILINILVYGPFVDVIGFIVGCIICFIVAALFESHLDKNGPLH